MLKKPEGCIKIEGYACFRCNAAFSPKALLLKKLEELRKKDVGYQLHSDYYVEESDWEASRDRFEQSPTAYCQVTLYSANDVRFYIIERSRKNCAGRIIHNTSTLGLRILTALFLGETKVELEEKTFVIGSCTYAKGGGKFYLSPKDTVVVATKKGGGYYNPYKKIEQVDALVFGQRSHRLEVLPVSYDRVAGKYFVDSGILRGFCQKHGIPLIPLTKQSNKKRNEPLELRDESHLHALGYNVGEQDGLSDAERQNILGDAADAGMPIEDIVRMLEFLINLNHAKSELRMACKKWERDKEFISGYKINHDSFAFAEKVRGIKLIDGERPST